MRSGRTHILSDVKMYFANGKKGNICSYLKLSDRCKWETGKSDVRERSKAELDIIAKTEGGYNKQRRLKPEVKAERVQKIRGFFLQFVCCSVLSFAYLLIFIHMQTDQFNNYYKQSHAASSNLTAYLSEDKSPPPLSLSYNRCASLLSFRRCFLKYVLEKSKYLLLISIP